MNCFNSFEKPQKVCKDIIWFNKFRMGGYIFWLWNSISVFRFFSSHFLYLHNSLLFLKKVLKAFWEIAQILCNATFPRIKVLMAGFYFFFSWTGMVNEIVHKGSNLERKMTMLYLGTEVYSRTREVVRLCEMITYYSMCRYILHSR